MGLLNSKEYYIYIMNENNVLVRYPDNNKPIAEDLTDAYFKQCIKKFVGKEVYLVCKIGNVETIINSNKF
jgi:hypothetical protein